jgi:D-alanyl-lipoteichoic acid acyltransferase DltB (MBOAT superfamily)
VSFVQAEFLAFFAFVFALYWALPNHRLQNLLLVVASYVFYGWVHPWMMGLLGGITLLNYAAGRRVAANPERGGPVVAVTVVLSIGVLCSFKYFGWFVDAFAAVLPESVRLLRVGLPLGLSFYTFHNLAYTIDVYRGRVKMEPDVGTYLLYGSYFPQLVAGPVERPSNMLPQFNAPRRFDLELVRSGFGLALWGAFKKLALADTITPFVDSLFQAKDPSFAMVWAGALGFTVQALADFSGYTDIARGTSRMLGIELMPNFDHPYLAATPMEFWQRWHMSFSTWLRDYVYVPACFSPFVSRFVTVPFTGEWSPFWHTTRALFITMLVSGIWHGSTWNFVVWGLYHATMATIYTAILAKVPKKRKKEKRWRWLFVPVQFGVTVVGMYIFREPSLATSWSHLWLNPFGGTTEQWVVAVSMLGLCLTVSLPLVAALLVERHVEPRLRTAPAFLPIQTTLWALLAVGIFSAVRTTQTDFIYFQF